MARFTALPSDTSEDDEKYVASPPRKTPPQPRTRRAFPPSRLQRPDDDAEMISDSGSSRADEEDEEGEEDPPSDSSRMSANKQRASARAMSEEPEEEESGESSRSSLEVALPEHRRGDPSIIPWAQRIGIDPQKMHVMHASLFPAQESAEAMKQLSVEKHDRARLTPNGLHRKHSRDSEGEGLRAATQEVCPTAFFNQS
jgi:nuclear pore complex protein Nup98-Nup96